MQKFKQFLNENFDDEVTKWNVVLFAGDYNPITRLEYKRIINFVANYIKAPETRNKFSKNVNIGAIVSDVDKEEEFTSFNEYDLTLEDRKYINSKFFGLKTFPVDMKGLLLITTLSDKDRLEKYNSEVYERVLSDLKSNFENANILIILNPNNRNHLEDLGEIQKRLEDENITIGFLNWPGNDMHDQHLYGDLKGIDKTGRMIKAVCLMDYYRPDPENLKYFSHQYGLSEIKDDIKSIHFKVGNERYLQPFKLLFPTLSIYEEEETNLEENTKFMFELLKKMYLKDEYDIEEDAGYQSQINPIDEIKEVDSEKEDTQKAEDEEDEDVDLDL